MRPLLFLFVLLCFVSPASAKIYKCTMQNGETAFQQTPCKGVSQIVKTDSAPTSASGFNNDCTMFNGHKLLGIGEIDQLSDQDQEAYLEWLFSDEAPSKEAKEQCAVMLEADNEKTQQQARKTKDAEALDSYSFTRIVQRQISACRGIAPQIAEDAQLALNDYKTESEDLRIHGESLAKRGAEIGGEQISAAEIEKGIRAKEQEVLDHFSRVSPQNQQSMADKCETTIAIIDNKLASLNPQ